MTKKILKQLGMENEFLAWKKDIKSRSVEFKKGERVFLLPSNEKIRNYYFYTLHVQEGDIGVIAHVFDKSIAVDFESGKSWFINQEDLSRYKYKR